MTNQQFLTAMKIISKNHTTKLIINKPWGSTIGNLGSTEFTIGITDCCASVFNNLTDEGFTLSMSDGITSVYYYHTA